MKQGLIHPLWTHIAAVVALLAGVVFTLSAMPLPSPAPIHFNFSGQPDSYGSPWMSTFLLLGLSVMYIVLSLILDEAWARQERRKSFNWISLFDDIIVAALAAVQIGYVLILKSGKQEFVFPWVWVVVGVAVAAAIAVALEKARPYRPYAMALMTEDVSQLKAEVTRINKGGQPLFYWEVQNPVYSNILAVAVPVIMVIAAVVVWAEAPWISIMMGVIGIVLTLMYGGFRTTVTRDSITVKMGLLGIPLLRVATSQVAEAETHAFLPLKDFGGYGIRFNREMKAYYLRGDRGVKITTHGGKKYLIGSDHPERLATVICEMIA